MKLYKILATIFVFNLFLSSIASAEGKVILEKSIFSSNLSKREDILKKIKEKNDLDFILILHDTKENRTVKKTEGILFNKKISTHDVKKFNYLKIYSNKNFSFDLKEKAKLKKFYDEFKSRNEYESFFIKNKVKKGHYNIKKINVEECEKDILGSKIRSGTYEIEIYYISDKEEIIKEEKILFEVKDELLTKKILLLSKDYPSIYYVLCIFTAVSLAFLFSLRKKK
ncbi:hypothetical protein GUI12_00280 [Anaplasmataceae bacterium AB001_6]|nr:hypothetical protein GUI12_00280 [Anaplasmataceae bacterium AB001_6]